MSHSINFLHRVEPNAERRKRAHRRVTRVGVLLVCGLAVAWAVVTLFAAGQVVAAALDGRDALSRARAAAEALDFDSAAADLAAADGRFAAAERAFVLLLPIRAIPWVSDQVRAADAMLSSGRQVVQALEKVVSLGAELVRLSGFSEEEIRRMQEGTDPSATFDDLSSDTKRAVLERLAASASDLELLSARIAIVRSELSDLRSEGIAGPVVAALSPIERRLSEAQDTVQTLSVVARLLPEFAGLGEERTHLVLFLNNTELRPGGGFIGTFGVLKTKDGDIVEMETRDSYALDDLAASSVTETPPAPLARYNAATRWFFRDSNWSPDFSVSAETAARLFRQEISSLSPEQRSALGLEDESFDGVIGVTPTFLSAVLGVTGPMTVGGQTFGADDVTDRLEYQVEAGYVGQGIPESQRKEVIADLMNAIKSSVFSLPLSEWEPLVRAVKDGFSNKQIAFASADDSVQGVLEHVGWAGTMDPGEGDVQLLVDANMASLKTDPAVSRSVRYEIFRNTSGQYIGRTSVRYAHAGRFDWKTTRYRTYVRLYVPAGSEFVRAEGSMLDDKLHNPSGAEAPVDVADELGMTSFGTFVSVEPGESRTLTFEYVLADSVVEQIRNGSYVLRALKQVGSRDNELTLDLDFDKNVTDASMPEDSGEWGDDVYRMNTKLDQDLEFTVGL